MTPLCPALNLPCHPGGGQDRAQLGFHQKPCALLNTEGYYQGLINFLHTAVTEGFVKQRHLDQLLIDAQPERLLERMARPQLDAQPKWEVTEA